MKIERFLIGIISTNCYIVQNEETKEAVVIDPAAAPAYVLSHVKSMGLEIKAILLTHGHFDHILGLDGWLKEWSVPVYAHMHEKELLEDPKLNMSVVYGAGYGFPNASYTRDGQKIEAAGMEFEVIHTPGHTAGGCCYYMEKEGVLFSGDTLFCHSMGRTDFPTGSEATLIRSIKEKLLVLPEETKVYPGHEAETFIGEEKRVWGI